MTDESLPVYYHGRLWDAPMTDGALKVDDTFLEAILAANPHMQTCTLCQEPMTVDDDILFLPYMVTHLECQIRSGLGDVQHLEGRCGICDDTEPRPLPGDEYPTYREGAKATVQWLLDHKRGRFHDDD